MKICDVVLNSIWYDPRVRKQIAEYLKNDIELSCVGFRCQRYNEEEIKRIPAPTTIATIDSSLLGKQKSVIRKLIREYKKNKAVKNAILKYNPDIIHANDLNALIPAYKAAKKLKCKIIYDSHEINVENYVSTRNNLLFAYLKWNEKFLVKKVDLMVCVSNAAAEYFAKEYNIKKPMVVTHGILKNEIIKTDVEKNDGFEIINHGQFYAGRGYDIMVEAAKLLKDYPEVHMCLRGFGSLESQLKEQKEKQNLDNVIFYEKVKVEELIPLASRSMVGVAITEPVCLNFELSVSNKLFEYVAAGLPVIMSDIPEHRYLNGKYHFGIILPENTPSALADAVLKLYQDKEFYLECQKNARNMTNECNWEVEFAKLLTFEKDLIKNDKTI